MQEHAVEMLDGKWLILSEAVIASTPIHAVIRTAEDEGQYRARRSNLPLEESEYFWVPNWGMPIPAKSLRP